MYKGKLVVLMLMLAFVFVSCSKAPETEITNAVTSIEQARTVEAEQYAVESYQKAIDAMNQARIAKEEQDAKFALLRDYDKVKEMYVSAQKLAEQAKSEAEAEKEGMKMEVESLMVSVQSAIEAANSALLAAPVAKGSRVETEVYRSMIDSIREAYDNTKLDVESGKFITAKTKLEALLKRTTDLTSELEAARMKKTS